jgi:uncharacterized membrane protein
MTPIFHKLVKWSMVGATLLWIVAMIGLFAAGMLAAHEQADPRLDMSGYYAGQLVGSLIAAIFLPTILYVPAMIFLLVLWFATKSDSRKV